LKQFGKYEVLGELGHGAMGVVYRARDPIINRLVALKTITTGVANDPIMLERFYREAQSAGSLQHPNIVTIYDMGEAGGLPYIAMELVEGENLDQVIARRTALPITLKLLYAMQAGRAFDYAHKRGIVHRDIKPGNVMVSKDGIVKVVDFGIARVLETSRTQTGMLIGTFAYMSPEQYHGEHADERSDIWSFGVLLYELLSYQRPFSGPTPASLMNCICNQDPSPLNKILQECPEEMEPIISRLLAKSPSERYQSMEDVLLELDPVCKALQSQFVSDLAGQSRLLIERGEFAPARDLLRQALQVESGNLQARSLLEKANTELRRIQQRPQVQQFVEKGQTFLVEKKLREAKVAAENALQLDSSFTPAQELLRAILRELDQARLLAEWLETAKQNLAEGLPDEAEVLLAKVLQAEPSHVQAADLQKQVIEEKEEREKRRRLLESLREARELWTHQNFDECIKLLVNSEKDFPGDEDVLRLLETVREDQVEQQKQQSLLESRNLLAARRFEECIALLTALREQFPGDEEIPGLLEHVRRDQLNHRRLQGLAEARSVLATGQFDACISLLSLLRKEFPDEQEIPQLLEAAQHNQAEQRRQRGMADARELLASRRYEECSVLLTTLEKQYPGDEEILGLQDAVREEQAERRKQQHLEEAGNLLAARRYDECATLLSSLEKEFPGDEEILKLQTAVREYRAKQRKLRGLEESRKLLAAKNFDKSLTLLAQLRMEFPEEDEVRKLWESAQKEQAEERKRESLAHARSLLAQRQYGESITVLCKLEVDFPGETEILKLLATAREDLAEQEKQQKLAEARSLLAGQSFEAALALLGDLASSHPKDSAVLKLRTLVEREQEKHARTRKIELELDGLKKLMGEKKYSEVISRTKGLLIEYPAETNFTRLAEFAMSQQEHIEKETLFKRTLVEAKAFLDGGRFEDAIRVTQTGLKKFPGNQDLLILCEQAEGQQKKLQIRQRIEQRVREIKVKINREKYSDAIELAKQTLATMGPDTDLSQLLNSAQMELEAREKKKVQEQTLQTIRTLMESGNPDGAGQMLDDAVESNRLESCDPQVQRLSEQIKEAKAPPDLGPAQGSPLVSPSLSREYALFQAAPLPSAPPSTAAAAPVSAPTAQACTGKPTLPLEPIAPSPPLEVMIPASETVPPLAPQIAREEAGLSVAPLSIPVSRDQVQEIPSPVQPSLVLTPHPVAQPPLVHTLRRPVVVAALAVALVVVIWAGMRSRMVKSPQVTAPPAKMNPAPVQPRVDPLEIQQRDALNAADKLVAANNLEGALRELQQAEALGGPLTTEIHKKITTIEDSLKDSKLRALRQREEVLWQQAMNHLAGGRVADAQKELRQVMALPEGGVRRQEAQHYLDKVVPQRILQDGFLTQARQALKQGDFRSARHAANQLKQSGGDPGEVVKEIDQAEQGRLAQAKSEFNQLEQRDDDAAVQELRALQLKFQALADDGGPQSNEALDYANRIPGAVAAVKARIQKKTGDAEFQQLVQRYQRLANSNDLKGLVAAKADFQTLVQGGGSHAEEAQKYLNELNNKIALLNQPPVAPPTSPVRKSTTFVTADNAAEVRAVILQYEQAFDQRNADALRQIWPGLGSKYERYKQIFDLASSIQEKVDIETLEFSPDGSKAVVKGQLHQVYTPKGNKTRPTLDTAIVFNLAKTNSGVWVITDVQ